MLRNQLQTTSDWSSRRANQTVLSSSLSLFLSLPPSLSPSLSFSPSLLLSLSLFLSLSPSLSLYLSFSLLLSPSLSFSLLLSPSLSFSLLLSPSLSFSLLLSPSLSFSLLLSPSLSFSLSLSLPPLLSLSRAANTFKSILASIGSKDHYPVAVERWDRDKETHIRLSYLLACTTPTESTVPGVGRAPKGKGPWWSKKGQTACAS